MTLARVDLTWGSLDYHKQSLRNLSEAMQQTGMLCAVIIDIVGREVSSPLPPSSPPPPLGPPGGRPHTNLVCAHSVLTPRFCTQHVFSDDIIRCAHLLL